MENKDALRMKVNLNVNQKVVQNEHCGGRNFVLHSQSEDHEKLQSFWEGRKLRMTSGCHTESRRKRVILDKWVSYGMTIYMRLLEEKVLHLWRGQPEELWQNQPLIRRQIFKHGYKSHTREFQCSVQFEYFALLCCSTLCGPFSAHLCQHQERWALERSPRLADPSGRGMEACPPGPPLHMSIIRHRVDLDFQASRDKKGKKTMQVPQAHVPKYHG